MATQELIVIDPVVTTNEVAFIIAPDDDKRFNVWQQARDSWLASIERKARGSKNTRRAYEHDWNEFFKFFELWVSHEGDVGLKPWQVGGAHVEMWIESLHDRGLAESTINRKLAALSSFYNFAGYKFTIAVPEGAKALWTQPNPFRIPDRVQVEAYNRSVYPALDDVVAILRTIAADTRISAVQRLRDLCLIGGLFFTTRRVSEWTTLTWGQIHETGEGVWFAYRYKGGKQKKQAIPKVVWEWVQAYLELDGRLGKLEPGDYIFLATVDTAGRFHRVDGRGGQVGTSYNRAQQPLSPHRVNDLLKKYGRKVGVADEQLHAHGLRHAGARARLADGAGIHELKDILGHGSIAITQIYTDRVLVTPEDARGDALAAKLTQQLKLPLKPTR
jgi:integrase/recombinase XerD